jgi:flagellar biosynthesis protein FliR/FlhB
MAVLFIFLRMLTFFIIVPIFFPKGTPNIMKVCLAGITAFILLPAVNPINIGAISSNYMLFIYLANEIITGLFLGYATNLVFILIRMAGQLIDMQMGLSMLSMLDPNSNTNATLMERLLYWVSLIVFFLIDGHHMLIRAMTESFKVVNTGSSILYDDTIMLVVSNFTHFFMIALKIAIPLVLIIIITDLTLGLVARTVPQLNVMILGLPIKIVVGLTCLSLALPIIIRAMINAFGNIPEVFEGIFRTIPLMFIFASEEKTEEATPKKKSDARKKGQVAKSKEISLAATLLASTLIIITLGGFIGNNLRLTVIHFLGNINNYNLDHNSVSSLAITVVWRLALLILPVVIPIMIMGVLANYVQTGFILSGDTIKPKLSKLNPLSGFKRIFSSRTIVELLKDLIIVTVVGFIGYNFVKENYAYILNISGTRIVDIPKMFSKLVIEIFFKVTLIMLVLAIADYVYQRYMHNKDLKMTKHEIKEEYKQSEGDPQIKSKIKQKQREMATRRMMQQIPDATVVVTNPTHIAVALKYQEGVSEAPVVVAKGSDYLAIKIKEIAKEHDIPILENKPLARMIYEEVEVDRAIPFTMYQAVAEILAIVYKMKKKK